MIVFLCTGIWHGANWTFILWGVVHGALSCLEKVGVIPAEKLNKSRLGRILCRVYTLMAVMLLFVVFRAETLSDAGALITSMFTGSMTALGTYQLRDLLTPANCLFLIAAVVTAAGLVPKAKAWYAGQTEGMQRVCLYGIRIGSIALLIIAILNLSRGGFNPFIYFQF